MKESVKLFSECCGVEFDVDEGRCRSCHEACCGRVEAELPYKFPGVDDYERGWNDCLDQIREINQTK